MAKGTGILALLATPKGGKAEKAGPPGAGSALSAKAAALKEMWSSLKSGDYDGAAVAFQDAYDACASDLGDEEEGDEPLLGDEDTDDEM